MVKCHYMPFFNQNNYQLSTTTTCFVIQLKALHLLNVMMFLFKSTEATTPILLPICDHCNSIQRSVIYLLIFMRKGKRTSVAAYVFSDISTSITLPPPLPGLHYKFIEYSLKLYSYHQVIVSFKTFTAFPFHQHTNLYTLSSAKRFSQNCRNNLNSILQVQSMSTTINNKFKLSRLSHAKRDQLCRMGGPLMFTSNNLQIVQQQQ